MTNARLVVGESWILEHVAQAIALEETLCHLGCGCIQGYPVPVTRLENTPRARVPRPAALAQPHLPEGAMLSRQRAQQRAKRFKERCVNHLALSLVNIPMVKREHDRVGCEKSSHHVGDRKTWKEGRAGGFPTHGSKAGCGFHQSTEPR